jgi:hypothetical protein
MTKFCHDIKILHCERSCRNHREASNETLKMVIQIYKAMQHKGAQPAVMVVLQDIPRWFRGNTKKSQTKVS